jgi:RNA polymerase sigma-70 factor (ECF subfamily)
VDGPAAALTSLDAIANDRRLENYQPYWATRAHLCARAGYRDDAHEAFTLAIGLATDPAVRRYLTEQRSKLADG